MENPHYNHIKATSKRDHSQICLRSALLEACQSKNIQPSVEQLYEIAHRLDVDVRELLVSSK